MPILHPKEIYFEKMQMGYIFHNFSILRGSRRKKALNTYCTGESCELEEITTSQCPNVNCKSHFLHIFKSLLNPSFVLVFCLAS